jgi:3-hydroxybutyryl-CoA dehydrogenase
LLKDLCAASEVSDVLKKPVSEGNYGTKTGKGIFEWSPEEIQEKNRKREKILIDFMLKEEKGNL